MSTVTSTGIDTKTTPPTTLEINDTIDIKGLDKKELLVALWINQQPLSKWDNSSVLLDNALIETISYQKGTVYLFGSRRIALDFSGDFVHDTTLYDSTAKRPARQLIKMLHEQNQATVRLKAGGKLYRSDGFWRYVNAAPCPHAKGCQRFPCWE